MVSSTIFLTFLSRASIDLVISGRIIVNYSGFSASVGLSASANFTAGVWSTVIYDVLARFNAVIGETTNPIEVLAGGSTREFGVIIGDVWPDCVASLIELLGKLSGKTGLLGMMLAIGICRV